jgi:hypothetical protein
MVKLNPNDICDYLASRADEDYKFIRFKGCHFDVANDELLSTFIFDERIKGKISGMKQKLEQEFKTMVGLPDLFYVFSYKQCYMDAGRLDILIQEFLRKNFSFLTLDISDDDLIVTDGEEGFTAKLKVTKQAMEYIKGSKAFKAFARDLTESHFAVFNFIFEEKAHDVNQKELTLEDIEKYAEEKLVAKVKDKVDKVCKVSDRAYLLGAPIKERPIRIEFLEVSPREQIIAGTISFFKRREYTKKDTGLPQPYWTFVLDDGKKASCVYFVSGRTEEIQKKNMEKMETLGDGQAICVIGYNNEKDGRGSFSVRGISTCVMG